MKPPSSMSLGRKLPSAGSLLVGILVGLLVATVSFGMDWFWTQLWLMVTVISVLAKRRCEFDSCVRSVVESIQLHADDLSHRVRRGREQGRTNFDLGQFHLRIDSIAHKSPCLPFPNDSTSFNSSEPSPRIIPKNVHDTPSNCTLIKSMIDMVH